jgi:hypothetical protein
VRQITISVTVRRGMSNSRGTSRMWYYRASLSTGQATRNNCCGTNPSWRYRFISNIDRYGSYCSRSRPSISEWPLGLSRTSSRSSRRTCYG